MSLKSFLRNPFLWGMEKGVGTLVGGGIRSMKFLDDRGWLPDSDERDREDELLKPHRERRGRKGVAPKCQPLKKTQQWFSSQ